MWYFLIMVGTLLFTNAVWSNGYVVTDATHDYYIKLDKSDIQNQAGYVTSPFGWDLNGTYEGTVTCPHQNIPLSSVYYKAVMSDGLVPAGGGFSQLNEFLDIKVEIWIAGQRREYVIAPFDNVSNNQDSHSCSVGGQTRLNFGSGSSGKVTFRVRKPIINGVQIDDRQVVELFGRLGNTVSDFNNTPMSRITISSAILYVPEKCVINGGQTIEVEFGDLPGSGLNGSNFEKTVPLSFRCEGGTFDQNVAMKVNLGVSGRPTSFGQEYLRTTKDGYQGGDVIDNLGVQFKQLDGSALSLNTFYPVSMQGNVGAWGFIAAPISDGSEVAAGDFYATATVVAEFQ